MRFHMTRFVHMGGVDLEPAAARFVVAAAHATAVWEALLAAGTAHGILPCGLGARDTLRLEAGMPLYGHELDDDTTPLEACLDFGVDLKKEFLGSDALRRQEAAGGRRRPNRFASHPFRLKRASQRTTCPATERAAVKADRGGCCG